ncbi:MAG: hypothetical protein WKF96_01280 [Solirubrobacteraceae bacterium]
MILPRKQADAVASARKTEHRIPAIDGGRTFQRSRTINGERRYYGPVEERPRQTLPLIGARISLGQHRRAVVLEIEESVTLTEPTRTIAKAEGYGNDARAVLELKRDWLARHDNTWYAQQAYGTDDGLTVEKIAARFSTEHVGRRIHIIHLANTEAYDEFMAPVGGSTSSPSMSIDPDAPMPPAEYVDNLAKQAEVRNAEMRASFKRDLEEERARRKAQSPRTLKRAERGRSLRDAA